MNKQNQIPYKKQGILYGISLGKNNGAYLAKDITYDNHKSLNLLTQQAKQAHRSYVNTLELISRQPENQIKNVKKIVEVESFHENYGFCLKEIKEIRSAIHDNYAVNRNLRLDLERLKQNITAQTAQLHQAALPALKHLRDKIKTNKAEQVATYTKIKRELENVEKSLGQVSNGIKQCERKINTSEHYYHVCSSDPYL